ARLGAVTTLVGDATLTRGAAAPRPVAFKDEVKPGDTIRTTPGALVRVLVRGATLVAIGESSTVALAADAGRSNVRLESGTVSVVASGAKPAPLDIRTPHATASLRGTSVIAQTGRGGAATTFYVLTGAVEVKAGAGAGLTVRALESTTVRGGSVGPIVAARMLPTRTHSFSGPIFTTALPVLWTCQAISQPLDSLQAMAFCSCFTTCSKV